MKGEVGVEVKELPAVDDASDIREIGCMEVGASMELTVAIELSAVPEPDSLEEVSFSSSVDELQYSKALLSLSSSSNKVDDVEVLLRKSLERDSLSDSIPKVSYLRA